MKVTNRSLLLLARVNAIPKGIVNEGSKTGVQQVKICRLSTVFVRDEDQTNIVGSWLTIEWIVVCRRVPFPEKNLGATVPT